MLHLTTSAADKIRDMAIEHQANDAGIRVMVVGGGARASPMTWTSRQRRGTEMRSSSQRE